MPKYQISYFFEGQGIATIKAKNEEQAEEFFGTGENWIDDDETGTDYEIDTITLEK